MFDKLRSIDPIQQPGRQRYAAHRYDTGMQTHDATYIPFQGKLQRTIIQISNVELYFVCAAGSRRTSIFIRRRGTIICGWATFAISGGGTRSGTLSFGHFCFCYSMYV